MMFNIQEVTKDSDVNRALRLAEQNRTPITILFTSLWDSASEDLTNKIKKKFSKINNPKLTESLYIVNSFDSPQSFTLFGTTKVPHLVNINSDGVLSLDYLPDIYKFLSIK